MPYRRIVLMACLLTVVALSAAAVASDPYSEFHRERVVGDTIIKEVDGGGGRYRFTRVTKRPIHVADTSINWKAAADDSTAMVINDTLVITTRRGASITVEKSVTRARPALPKPTGEMSWKSGKTTVTLSPDGTLRVKGIGAMQNYGAYEGDYPKWREFAITGLTIEEGVASLGNWAFAGLTGLKSVTIPNSVAEIGRGAFGGCTGLTSVRIPGGVTTVGDWAFRGCGGLMSITVAADNARYSSEDGVLFNRDKTALLQFPPGMFGAYTVPGGVKSIVDEAFMYCANLTSVTVPGSVASIGKSAFSDCTGLTSVTIKDGVASIGERAFWNCPRLASAPVPGSVTSIGESAFAYTGLTSVTIPGSVASIGIWAFSECTGLASITVAADNAHYSSADGVLFNKNKTALIQFPPSRQGAYTIPGSVATIRNEAFSRSSLTSVTIPGNVKSIEWAFSDCANLTSVTIGDGVKLIGNEAFSGCHDLASIIVKSPKPPEFGSYWGNACLYVPKGSIAAYRAAEGWKKFKCIKDLKSAPGGE